MRKIASSGVERLWNLLNTEIQRMVATLARRPGLRAQTCTTRIATSAAFPTARTAWRRQGLSTRIQRRQLLKIRCWRMVALNVAGSASCATASFSSRTWFRTRARRSRHRILLSKTRWDRHEIGNKRSRQSRSATLIRLLPSKTKPKRLTRIIINLRRASPNSKMKVLIWRKRSS